MSLRIDNRPAVWQIPTRRTKRAGLGGNGSEAMVNGLAQFPFVVDPLSAGADAWSAAFPRWDWPQPAAVLLWCLAHAVLVAALYALAGPGRTRRRSAERWLLCHSLALPAFAGPLWVASALTPLRCTPGAVRLAFGLFVGLAAALAAVRHRRRRRHGLCAPAAGALPALLGGSLLFWAAYAFFAWLRAHNPDLWGPMGGEKPMDFAYLLSAARAAQFPPPNPWLAGAAINYYYVGFALVAIPIKLTGIAPELAYNLAVPFFAAMSATACFCAAARIARLVSPLVRGAASASRIRRPMVAGLAAVALALLCGNLAQWRLPFSSHPWASRPWYWDASRAIVSGAGVEPITEFPFFTLLYGDLHAHLMALPLQLALLAILAGFVARPSRPAILGAGGLCGLLCGVNAWCIPPSLALLFLALAASFLRRGPGPAGRRAAGREFLVDLAIALLAAAAVAWPFTRAYRPPVTGLGLWRGPWTPLRDHVLIHGPLLLGAVLVGVRLAVGARARLTGGASAGLLFYGGGWFLVLGLIAGPELLFVDDGLGRMNTVFKLYFQAWPLAGVLLGAGLGVLWRARTSRGQALLTGGVLALLAGQLLYVATAVPARARDRAVPGLRSGLDGTACLNVAMTTVGDRPFALRWDWDAIGWVRRHARATDVVLEGHLPEYQWGARYATFTGLSTPIGWRWHSMQQLPPVARGVVDGRIGDVHEIYRTTSVGRAAELLRRYDVRWIVVGPVEHAVYPADGLAKFGRPAESGPWHLVYSNTACCVFRFAGD